MGEKREVNILKQGDSFGDLALLYETTRTATVVAHERLVVVVINRENFQKSVKEIKSAHLERIVNLYKKAKCFHRFSDSFIVQLAGKSELRVVPSNTVVVKEGEDSKYLFFILQGRAKIKKTLHFRPVSSYSLLNEELYMDPSEDEITSGKTEKKSLDVMEVGEAGWFAEEAYLLGSKMLYTVVTCLPSEIAKISLYDLKQMVSKEREAVLLDYVKKLPKSFAIRKKYYEEKLWGDYKKKINQEFMNEIKNKKYKKRSDKI